VVENMESIIGGNRKKESRVSFRGEISNTW